MYQAWAIEENLRIQGDAYTHGDGAEDKEGNDPFWDYEWPVNKEFQDAYNASDYSLNQDLQDACKKSEDETDSVQSDP